MTGGIITPEQLRKRVAKADGKKKPRAKRLNPARPTEDQEQEAYFKWLARFYPKLYEHATAVPHGGARHARVGSALKRQGVRAGYPDILIDYPVTPYHGLRIELKRSDGGRVSEAQQGWIDRLRIAGYCAGVAHGCGEAMRVTESYLSGQGATWSNGYAQTVVDLIGK